MPKSPTELEEENRVLFAQLDFWKQRAEYYRSVAEMFQGRWLQTIGDDDHDRRYDGWKCGDADG